MKEKELQELNQTIPLIIPSYEPDQRLLNLLSDLKWSGFTNVILVNDGSGEEYSHFFEEAKAILPCTLLVHEVNKGKGRALKTALAYCLDHIPGLVGCVTADSDGQHLPKDIIRMMEALCENPKSLIMGSRCFDQEDIPWKSVCGNKITRFVTKLSCGISCSDTQTGLRGIPAAFMRELLDVEGERFEFEMNMLVDSKDKYPIKEVSITTVYDSKENHSTHFDPVKDSIRVYRIFLKRFLRFLTSSLSSAVVDLALFSLFCHFFKPFNALFYVTAATVSARVISATYNYLINYFFVFESKENKGLALAKYAALATVQMCLSATLTTAGKYLFPTGADLVIKIIVDVTLFVFSYFIQKELVFKKSARGLSLKTNHVNKNLA